MTLDAIEFLRRFLQHVLPSGFQKVRHYGFLSPNSGTPIEAVRRLITSHSNHVPACRLTAHGRKRPLPAVILPAAEQLLIHLLAKGCP